MKFERVFRFLDGARELLLVVCESGVESKALDNSLSKSLHEPNKIKNRFRSKLYEVNDNC